VRMAAFHPSTSRCFAISASCLPSQTDPLPSLPDRHMRRLNSLCCCLRAGGREPLHKLRSGPLPDCLWGPYPAPTGWTEAVQVWRRSRTSSPCLESRRDPWHDRGMPWVFRRRWQILAGGLVLLLLGLVPRGPVTDVRSVLVGVGLVLVIWAMLGVLLAIPMALRGRREAPRPPDSN
jgi:hypothetical protein